MENENNNQVPQAEVKPAKKKFTGVKFVVGILLVIGSFSGLQYLGDWSTSEAIGFNAATLVGFIGGLYLVFSAYKSLKK